MRKTQGNYTSQFAKGMKKDRDRPYCTNCKKSGHTIEKCYRLHDFPPGFKSSPKVYNVATDVCKDSQPEGDLTSLFQRFSTTQCQRLMAALSGHFASASINMATSSGVPDSSQKETISKKMIGRCRNAEGLYVLSKEDSPSTISVNAVSLELWHQ